MIIEVVDPFTHRYTPKVSRFYTDELLHTLDWFQEVELVPNSPQFLEDQVKPTESKYDDCLCKCEYKKIYMYGILWVCDPQLRPLRPGASLAGTFARQTGRVFVGPSLPECPWAPCIFLYEHVQSTMPCARMVYTHTHLYGKKHLHTEAFTQRSLSHRWALHREALPQTSSVPLQNRILPQCLMFDPHFVRKACI